MSFGWLPPEGTWCSGITSASHAAGPGFKSQCVHLSNLRCRRRCNRTIGRCVGRRWASANHPVVSDGYFPRQSMGIGMGISARGRAGEIPQPRLRRCTYLRTRSPTPCPLGQGGLYLCSDKRESTTSKRGCCPAFRLLASLSVRLCFQRQSILGDDERSPQEMGVPQNHRRWP